MEIFGVTCGRRKVASILSALLLVFLAPIAHAAELSLDTGHIDAFAVRPDGDGIALSLQEDVTGSHVQHAPEDVTLVVGEQAYTADTESVDGIGAPGYLLPQTQQSDLIWPGWDTQALAGAGISDIDIEFLDVSGPGEVYLFQAQGLGGVGPVLDDATLALNAGATIHQDTPAHAHANWLFTEPGTYTMRVVAHAGGAKSNEATYTWMVGEGDAAETTPTPADSATRSDDTSALGGLADTDEPEASHRVETYAGEPAEPAEGPEAATAEASGSCKPALSPQVKDDRQVPATWNDPATMVFGLGDAATTTLPEDVGPIPAGEAWMIGATQQAGVPWLGANTQHESLLEHTTGEVTWEVTDFDGPGNMFVFTQGGLGKIVGEEWFRAEHGTAQGAHTIPANSHVHPNWVFSAPGTYHVTVRHTATAKDGTELSGAATLTFEVGGSGNADDGHFDFGSVYDAEGDCGGAGAAGTGSAGPAGSADSGSESAAAGGAQRPASGSRSGGLAETGPTVMTLPIAVLGIGVLVFGGGMLCLDTALRRRLLAALGATK
ncbi:TIGR03773 family transporter-associated surface protein [Corynebacterium sp. NML180780]|uniref:TIGR03773 family transporter-associated surface protein n=1 Tax=Corynebacterium sp. NML180780 TaxID=2598459 RepID=UPI001196244E|nr:TIGR03773 family transporter-associated surface protein [Corynebacterium sp. NML180780]TVX82628.1 cell surface protein [Corynebacterium sp. NML180780]